MAQPDFTYHQVSYFAKTNFRASQQVFGIHQADRLFHLYCMGKSGTGKTSLLTTLMLQDVDAQRGFTFIDVHGDASRTLVQQLSKRAKQRLVYIDVTNPKLDYGYNPLPRISPTKRSLVASNLLEVFKRTWKSAWGMKMEHILRMVLLTLLDQPQAQFSDILKLIDDKAFRQSCLRHIDNEDIVRFWQSEFPKYKATDLVPIMSKVSSFLSHRMVRKILIENTKNKAKLLSFRRLIDQEAIVIINLAKGQVGSDVTSLLGGLLLTSLSSAFFSRIDTLEHQRVPHFLYIDEFQTISSTELIAELLAQVRKFKIGLILANQFLHQLDQDVRSSVLGNVGTMISFRLGISDARLMAKEFYPVFKAEDFTALANHSIYLRLMIQGKPSLPFSADTIL